jgi:hypothetical protein
VTRVWAAVCVPVVRVQLTRGDTSAGAVRQSRCSAAMTCRELQLQLLLCIRHWGLTSAQWLAWQLRCQWSTQDLS